MAAKIRKGDNVVVLNGRDKGKKGSVVRVDTDRDRGFVQGVNMMKRHQAPGAGDPGGIKETTAGKIMSGRFPERAIELAVKRMMPGESPLAKQQYSKLRVYTGAEHPHEAQKPETVDYASMNSKNQRDD